MPIIGFHLQVFEGRRSELLDFGSIKCPCCAIVGVSKLALETVAWAQEGGLPWHLWYLFLRVQSLPLCEASGAFAYEPVSDSHVPQRPGHSE